MRTDPAVTLLIILIIGIVAGIVFDRVAGPGWLSRQLAGSTRGMVTSSLVGIAGAFIGFHLGVILGLLPTPLMLYLCAIVGALAVLWLWRGR